MGGFGGGHGGRGIPWGPSLKPFREDFSWLEQRGSYTPIIPCTPWVSSKVLGLEVGRSPLGTQSTPQNLAVLVLLTQMKQ